MCMVVAVGVLVRPVIAGIFMMLVPVTYFVSMLVDMEKADHEESQQHASHDRIGHMIDGLCLGQSVGN